ncbi:MAG: SDR family NAD(P)-dependent oxidoreductase [Chloroflexota bacterium]
MQLISKTIILTGAASGIGQTLLMYLAQYNTTIIAVDINETQLRNTIQQLGDTQAKIISCIANLTQQVDVDRVFDITYQHTDHIDIFIANAGFAYYEKIDGADWQHIERIYQLNTISPLYSALKMAQQGRPYKVVITASAMAHWALSGYALYSSTKAALHSFATAYREEIGDPNSLMLVYPIATRTSFFDAAAKNTAPTPFPSQTAEYVANRIIKGIEADKKAVYPSLIFIVAKFLNRFLPIQWINHQLESARFKRWLAQSSSK